MTRLLVALVVALAALSVATALGDASPGCSASCQRRVQARELDRAYHRRWSAAGPAVRAAIRVIVPCESGNDERAVSANGLYRGLLQFDLATWRSVGGRGDPIDATRIEQLARGATLYRRRGSQPWPICGRRVGR